VGGEGAEGSTGVIDFGGDVHGAIVALRASNGARIVTGGQLRVSSRSALVDV
jgi:hypothetical protein